MIGVVERDSGEIRLEVCPNANKETCHEVIEKHGEPGSTLNPDDWGGYNGLEDKGIKHKTVCHSQGEYARDDDGDGINEVHENTMEAIWSLLRQCGSDHTEESERCTCTCMSTPLNSSTT